MRRLRLVYETAYWSGRLPLLLGFLYSHISATTSQCAAAGLVEYLHWVSVMCRNCFSSSALHVAPRYVTHW
ncbi:hypothetical protein K491DRAFT_643897 [Lophiostoma macrostomum CBS 122681]|uniref:Uncharacterized protein n=1 Tax=Lophiostoma macrostomum CBS 122681 TaxID=1314788 RepID=A0A6A6SJG7_9PLEO|nr:hypothetical protein K491DRAFT_643897 [Lophiostoma macrostomum CBS 122681]